MLVKNPKLRKISAILTTLSIFLLVQNESTLAFANSSYSKETKVSTVKKKKSKVTKKSGIYTGKYGYTGRKDSTDTNIPPKLSGWATEGTKTGTLAFKLPDVASASNILKLFEKDYPGCKKIEDPTANAPLALTGTVAADTLAACSEGDPKGTGYIIYFVTDKATVQKYQDKSYVELFKNFKSPVPSSLASIYFTPSSRAIIFSTGGEYAFDASEVAWGVIFNLGYTPPKR